MTASSQPKQTLQDAVNEARLTHACQMEKQQPFSVRLVGQPSEPDPAEITMLLDVLISITIRIATEQDKDEHS